MNDLTTSIGLIALCLSCVVIPIVMSKGGKNGNFLTRFLRGFDKLTKR